MLATLPDLLTYISQDRWSEWLALLAAQEVAEIIRRNVEKDLPCGNDDFIDTLEKISKRALRYKPLGRPIKQDKG